jgi:hypothetical protein
MKDKVTLGMLIVAGLTLPLVAGPALATMTEDFLTIRRATVQADNEELRANLITEGLIPTDGSGGAFGYGILTEDGDAILVSTTHPGVLDSEEQNYILDPAWHNHFVRLGEVDQCGEDPGVVDLTWQSPGEVRINNNIVNIRDVPTDEFEGWHSITGEELTMTLGEDVSDVVSFGLAPVFGEGGLEAVCVTDITSAEDVRELPLRGHDHEFKSIADDSKDKKSKDKKD